LPASETSDLISTPPRTSKNSWARLKSFLLSRDPAPKTAWETIGWWEIRRIPYNMIVGITGVFTSICFVSIAAASDLFFHVDFGMPDPPIFTLFGVLIYGIGANLCYTGGWIVELLVRKLWPSYADQFARLVFGTGLVISVLLTLSPALLLF